MPSSTVPVSELLDALLPVPSHSSLDVTRPADVALALTAARFVLPHVPRAHRPAAARALSVVEEYLSTLEASGPSHANRWRVSPVLDAFHSAARSSYQDSPALQALALCLLMRPARGLDVLSKVVPAGDVLAFAARAWQDLPVSSLAYLEDLASRTDLPGWACVTLARVHASGVLTEVLLSLVESMVVDGVWYADHAEEVLAWPEWAGLSPAGLEVGLTLLRDGASRSTALGAASLLA